jgi:3-oxoacyl-[acyl-carrier protein] reductase
MARFTGKTVLVTGGAGGLGLAIAGAFAGEGAAIVLLDRDGARLADAVGALQGKGARASAITADLSVEGDLIAAARTFCESHDRLDVLVNNAGLAYGEVATGFFGLGMAKWQNFLTVNTVAPLLLAEHLRSPLAAARGVIVNQSSMASQMPATAYGITKSALNAVTFALANQLAPDGIRCVGIAPGLMETEASMGALGDEAMGRLTAMQLAPARRGLPADIANACLFVASDEGGFINNTVLPVDGGNRMRGYKN